VRVFASARLSVGLVLPISLAAGLGFTASCGSSDSKAEDPPDAAAREAAPLVDDAAIPDTYVPETCATDRASDGMWQHLRCAGMYSDIAAKKLAPELRSYKPALELWADGAQKQRYIALPAGAKIDTSNMDEWVFPNGTRLFKEFKLDGKRIETRLYEKGMDGTWRHASFRWKDDESDAERMDGGVFIPRGGPDVPPYQIPSANECNDCHQGRTDKVLGFEAVNLGLAGAEGLTLATLVSEGLLTNAPSSRTLVFPEDATGKAAAALAWLHVSCGPCHNRSSAAQGEKSRIYLLTKASQLDAEGGAATVDSLDAFTTTVGKATTLDIPDGGGAMFYVIKGGDPSASRVSYLSGRRVSATGNPNEKEQMPPIVTRLVDALGHALLDAWITALPP
jgi:hypothetical protein